MNGTTVERLVEDEHQRSISAKALTSPAPGPRELTPRQRELALALAALLMADYRAFPPDTVESRRGLDRQAEAVQKTAVRR